MADIFHFVPKSQLESRQNLEQFIAQCKNELIVFGCDLNWNDWLWRGVGNFTKLGVNSRSTDEKDKLDESIIDFAKAYFRYQQGHNPTGTKNELKALRGIESALIQFHGKAAIEELNMAVLDEAAQKIRCHYSAGAAYHGGKELERLAKFISSKRLISRDLSGWKSPIPRKRDEIQTGLEAKKRRDKKLPSEDALSALAEIFSNSPTLPRDIFTSSTFAMLMSAPSRISEVLDMRVNCEVEEVDSTGKIRYGWRFNSGKGFGANIKWIPTEMVGIAKEAVRRITNLTAESRKLARWIESNETRFYRHSNCPDVEDDEKLTALQVCQALGFSTRNKRSAKSSLVSAKLDNKDYIYTLNSLWEHVLSCQPNDILKSTASEVKYSDSLFCMQRNLLSTQHNSSPVIIWMPKNNTLNSDLSPRESLGGDYHQSIFDRYSYLNEEGKRFKLTSHQARHLLNTMAQRGGLSQLEIAKWSGRADPNQNRTYNHMSEFEMVARAEQVDPNMTLFGPLGDVGFNPPLSMSDFNTLEKGPIHVTEYGVCVHDFTMSPCDKYRDCINCSEQVCIKGDADKLGRIRSRLEEVERQYLASEQALSEGISGADRWYEYHKNTAIRLKQLVSILENPQVESGAQIKLKNDKSFSPLRRAVESKLKVENEFSEQLVLKDILRLIGGSNGKALN